MIFHFLAIACIFTSILTGLRIRLVWDPSFIWLSPLLPQGEMHWVHIYSGVVFTALGLNFLCNKNKNTNGSHSLYHLWVKRFGYMAIISALTTGWLKYFQTPITYLPHAHFIACLAIVVFIFLHSYIYILQLGIKLYPIIMPLHILKKVKVTRYLMVFISFCLVFFMFEKTLNTRTLVVNKINFQQFIDIDGEENESFWHQIKPVKIFTTGGANFINGSTEVSVKAVANPEEVYFLFQWQDPSQSLTHMPLLKKNGKWSIQQNGFYQFDEQVHYEDKFAVLVSNSCQYGGDGTAKLGPKPLTDKPRNFHNKGYHASTDNKIRDLWHWKAVRTNNMFLADDNHIGIAKKVRTAQRRYSAGYTPDGKESGAYVMNWDWYQKQNITPKRLPIASSLLNLNPKTDKAWILPWFESKPYDKSKDTFKDGTLLPSVLYRSNRFEGDRADIRARGKWHKGVWTLELARKRNTGSKHDIKLKNDVCLWTSAFDHAQIAHTRHERPLKLKFASL